MDKNILTPYFFFFIDENGFLNAFMKDKRIRQIKTVDPFFGLSADKQKITGILFDGERTYVTEASATFDENGKKDLDSFFGYYYYPALNCTGKKMAVFSVDLLHPQNKGELHIFRYHYKKWRQEEQMEATVSPCFWGADENTLYYLDKNGSLVQKIGTRQRELLEGIHCFALSPDESEIVYLKENKVGIYDMKRGETIQTFPGFYVTSLAFGDGGDVCFATEIEDKNAVYTFKRATGQTTLLFTYPYAVKAII